jgi:predicted  nucleic acid-binding Zn ribbon protein
MKYIKMILKPKEKPIDDINEKEIEIMEYFLWSLCFNGQIQDGWEVVKTDNNLTVFITQVDGDSLDEKYDGEYVKRNKKEMEPIFELTYETVGTNYYSDKICRCKNPSFYILYTAEFHFGSPVICGDCGRSIPMYKLPLPDPKDNGGGRDYSWEIGWEKTYKNVDSIWRACLADRWSERQIINPKSALSKQGRDICKSFEKVTGKMFYYFLFDSDFNAKFDLQGKCPECEKNWRVQKINDTDWLFCDRCKLCTKKYWKE